MAHEGPYLIHCTEGKDRAGFVSALLEALVGSSVEEIKDDYMCSFTNYYGVEYGSEQYEKIAESNVLASLRDIAGLPAGASLEGGSVRRGRSLPGRYRLEPGADRASQGEADG